MSKYLYGIIAILYLVSCRTDTHIKVENNLSNDEREIYFVLKSDTNIIDGLYVRVSSKSDTLETVDYIQGEIDGQRILYYPNGKVKIVENYIQGKYNGTYQQFYENGEPKQLGAYKDNQLTGELKSYYELPAGQLRESVFFENGEEHGPFKQYYPNGLLEAEGSYKNGMREGEFKEYHSNGNLSATGKYSEDFEDGEIKIYDTTGVLIKIYVFEDKRPKETIVVNN